MPPRRSDLDLALIIVAVDDLAAAVRFWTELTGWVLTDDAPVYHEMRSPSGTRLGLYSREAFAENLGVAAAGLADGSLMPAEVYLAAHDVAEAAERAARLGATVLAPAALKPWGDTVAYVLAPGGFVVGFASSAPASVGESVVEPGAGI
ncbi:VOC family protein [Cellulomonas soli]|uniref:VOC family protein n=1 Tax=Cellulomonas soli TaxID=931535 RepID=UPI003F83DEF2